MALPRVLVDLQVCLFAVTLGPFFLWEAGCLLEVAGMVEGGRGKVTRTRHGSQLNVYLIPSAKRCFIVFFCPSDAQAKLFFHCERAVHNLKHQAQGSFNQ